ncbi:MAG: MarR family transcriptional regulator [Sphingomonadales bacterium]|nr:MarR family transcriptional regulator [Sphingomonadales bacterium]
MTPLQLKVLNFISARLEATKLAPSYVEIRDHLGHKSKSSVARIVDALVAQGHLRRSSRRHRGLEPIKHGLSRIPTAELRAELARRNQADRA